MTWPDSAPTRRGRIPLGTRVGLPRLDALLLKERDQVQAVRVAQVQQGLAPAGEGRADQLGSPPARLGVSHPPSWRGTASTSIGLSGSRFSSTTRTPARRVRRAGSKSGACQFGSEGDVRVRHRHRHSVDGFFPPSISR